MFPQEVLANRGIHGLIPQPRAAGPALLSEPLVSGVKLAGGCPHANKTRTLEAAILILILSYIYIYIFYCYIVYIYIYICICIVPSIYLAFCSTSATLSNCLGTLSNCFASVMLPVGHTA